MTVSPQAYTEGTDGGPTLGFVARTVTLDNYSNSWLWIAAARRYLRPFTTAVFPLVTPVDVGEIMWRTPPGIVQPTSTTGQLLAYWNDQALPPTQPQPIFASQTEPTVIASASSIVALALGNPYAVPAATLALACVVSGSGSAVVNVVGKQTGIIYFNAAQIPPGDPLNPATGVTPVPAVPFDPRDMQVTITANSLGGGTLDVIAYPFIPSQTVAVAGTVFTNPALPVTGNILGGSVSSATTIITIPAGDTWKGSVWIAAENVSPNTNTSTQVKVSGAGATPPNGTVLATVNCAATGTNGTIAVPEVYVAAPAANSVDILVAVAGTPTFNAGADGLLL